MALANTSLPTPVSPTSRISVSVRASRRSLRAGDGQRWATGRQRRRTAAAASSCIASSSAAVTMRNTSTCEPRNSTAPSRSGAGPVMRRPSTKVPLVLPRSCTMNRSAPLDARWMRACDAGDGGVRRSPARPAARRRRRGVGWARRPMSSVSSSIATMRGARSVSGAAPLPMTMTQADARRFARQAPARDGSADIVFVAVTSASRDGAGAGPDYPERR